MFGSKQYRAKAAEYAELVTKSTSASERREFQELEKSFSVLADNEQWMEEEHVLRCLGAALIMQWSTLPTKLQRELFDNAGSMGELLESAALRGQIARFLHKHKNDGEPAAG
jgi:hypothetical protein